MFLWISQGSPESVQALSQLSAACDRVILPLDCVENPTDAVDSESINAHRVSDAVRASLRKISEI